MSTAIATTAVDRISKLLRLALVADQDGEAIAAIGALKRSLDSSGLDPHWIVDSFARGAASGVVTPDGERDGRDRDDGHDDRSRIWFAFHRRHRLSAKERAFIENIVTWRGSLSARQRKWLGDIVDKLDAG